MLKRLLILAALLMPGTAFAATSPTDMVGVHLWTGDDGEQILAKNQKKYFKKWKEINLAAATKAMLVKKNQALDAAGYGEKFRIAFIFVAGDELKSASFYGDNGTVVMTEFLSKRSCTLSFMGSGGFAGVTDKPCHDD